MDPVAETIETIRELQSRLTKQIEATRHLQQEADEIRAELRRAAETLVDLLEEDPVK